MAKAFINGTEVTVYAYRGDGEVVVPELTSIFDRIYEASPLLFEAALVSSKYTEDHT